MHGSHWLFALCFFEMPITHCNVFAKNLQSYFSAIYDRHETREIGRTPDYKDSSLAVGEKLFLTLFLQYCPYMIADYIESVQSGVTPSLIRVRPYKILYCYMY